MNRPFLVVFSAKSKGFRFVFPPTAAVDIDVDVDVASFTLDARDEDLDRLLTFDDWSLACFLDGAMCFHVGFRIR